MCQCQGYLSVPVIKGAGSNCTSWYSAFTFCHGHSFPAFGASLSSFFCIFYNHLKFCLHPCCVPVLKYNYAHSVEEHFPWYQHNKSNLDEASHFPLSQLAKLNTIETGSFPSPSWWTSWEAGTTAANHYLTHTSRQPGGALVLLESQDACFSLQIDYLECGEKYSAKERKTRSTK